MRFSLFFAIWASLLLLSSCGGSTPASGGLDATQGLQELNDFEPPAQEEPELGESDPDPGGPGPDTALDPEYIPPTGVAQLGLSREVLDTVELPVMKPELYNADDEELPQLWLFKVAEGSTVFGQVMISSLSIDDTGTNLVALLIDEQLVAVSESETLEYVWNTRETPDGTCELIFAVRDNGGNFCTCRINVEVDNTTDFGPPKITVEQISCEYQNQEYKVEHNLSTHHRRWLVAGQADLTISAWDAAGVNRIELYTKPVDPFHNCTDKPIVLAEYELVGYADEEVLNISLDSSDWTGTKHYLIRARTRDGESSTLCIGLTSVTTTNYFVRFHNPEDEHIEGVKLYRMPPGWTDTGGELDLSVAVDESVSDDRYRCYFKDVPLGPQTFVAVYEEHTIVIPYLPSPLRDWCQLPEQGYIYILD